MNYASEVVRAYGTLREMLRDRGVADADRDCAALAGEDIAALAAGRSVFHVDLVACRHRLVFNLNTRFKLADVKKLLDGDMADAAPPAVIVVVTRDLPTTAGLKSVDELRRDVQFFQLAELQVNRSHHALVPPHEPVRDEAAVREVLKRYQLKARTHLPLILTSDFMARYLALKPGQLVKITRASPTAGRYTLWRCCVRAQ
jgi:DNA-directed RNA polymerase I, II, and III subunit RPABC1